MRRPVVKGENHVDLCLWPAELEGRIRLDPGDEPGVYTIDFVALYALPVDSVDVTL